ncbi:MAG: hypothetical protein CMK50_06565 [Propionibacteriaceae bacterium]|nr:hypothetical protein [Propionibacteriaceae bacterium]
MTLRKIPDLPGMQHGKREMNKRKRMTKTSAVSKMLLESALLLLLGIGLLAGLSLIPTKVDGLVVISEAIADLIRGLSQLLEAFLGLSAIILITALLVLGLLAILSGLVRLIRAISILSKTLRQKKISSSNTSRNPADYASLGKRRRLKRKR